MNSSEVCLHYILLNSLNYCILLTTNLQELLCELTGIIQGKCRTLGLIKCRPTKLGFPGHFPPPRPPFHRYPPSRLVTLTSCSAILHTHLLFFFLFRTLAHVFLSACLKCPILALYMAAASSFSGCLNFISQEGLSVPPV